MLPTVRMGSKLFAIFFLLASAPALAGADARLEFLTRQLQAAKDPRARAQTAIVLGASKSPEAVGPLCRALQDSDGLVRAAVAKALGDLRQLEAINCLKARRSDPNKDVQFAVARAIESLEAPQGGGSLYVALGPVVDATGGSLGPEMVKMTEELLRQKLSRMGAVFAPANENRAVAKSVIRARKLHGWMLMVKLLPHPNNGLKISLLALTYPEQSIKGDYSVKASGGRPPDLIRAMVPKVVDDAAEDLEWGNP